MGRKLLKILITHWGFIVSLIVIFGLSYLRFQRGEIQQDNYLGYAAAIKDRLSQLADVDRRLFPGLPLVILLGKYFLGSYAASGYLAVFSAFFGSYFILYKLTGSKYSFLPLVFPPALLNQASIIATDFPVLFLILLGFYLFKKEKYGLAFFIFGLSVWIRAVGTFAFLGILIFLVWQKKLAIIKHYLAFFIIPVFLLGLYNLYLFGFFGFLHPYLIYYQGGKVTLGFLQLFWDIPRAFRWGWYRIFISGTAYVVLFLTLLGYTIQDFLKSRYKENSTIYFMIWTIAFFLLILGFTPYLENFGRYLVPLFPLAWILEYKRLENPFLAYPLLLLAIGVVLF